MPMRSGRARRPSPSGRWAAPPTSAPRPPPDPARAAALPRGTGDACAGDWSPSLRDAAGRGGACARSSHIRARARVDDNEVAPALAGGRRRRRPGASSLEGPFAPGRSIPEVPLALPLFWERFLEMVLSRLRSATLCFSFRFSSRSCRNSRRSLTPIPPYGHSTGRSPLGHLELAAELRDRHLAAWRSHDLRLRQSTLAHRS
jgi:hypothetical protein